MRTIDKESNTGKIIRALGFGVGITVALSNRRTSYGITKLLVKEIFGLNKKPKNISFYFLKLRKQKLIEIKKDGHFHKLTLTENGQEVFLRFNYEELIIKKPKLWDRSFRVIVFDIPEKKRAARDSLREKMKELGCIKFNDSVWVYPYPCQKEIDFVANYWGIGKYVHFILAKDITNRDILEKAFGL
ncbi:MAG: Transcriptional regulator, PaaX family [Parcubacteria group bacterium GW2011_GWB1_36_5]|nr:MAG: Transcriptional regulator, PaaX family [Parcubacteria group bacterium GW2011_GWB1_36_5]